MNMQTLWRPNVETANKLRNFGEEISSKYGCSIETYTDLHAWSISNPVAFWSEVWTQCAAVGYQGDQGFAANKDMATAQFFPNARLNYAENCLQKRGDDPAILFRREDGSDETLSWDALHDLVSCAQQALHANGVRAGDRVVGLMPNIPATAIYMLATASLGAVWSSCSPDFGAGAVLDRFAQIAPKVMVAVDGYTYKGEPHELDGLVDEISQNLPDLKAILHVPFLTGRTTDDPNLSGWIPAPVTFQRVGFNDPLFVMFSSGTSGPPKCIVHRVGGVVLQHLKEHQLHCDLQSGDRLFYFSTCSWMMWNWLVSGLASGASIVLYDGSPTHPNSDILWDMAAKFNVTHFGTSAKYLDALRKADVKVDGRFDLSDMRMILSTGSPLSERNFDYVYKAIHPAVLLASISGGTDILSCFLLGCPTLPVKAGELQCAGLGMDVVVLGADGAKIRVGVGELVCRSPFPSQPTGFWGDEDGSKFRSTYFERFPGVWSQKDRVEVRPSGGFVVLGRSDTTLNPGGVRIGTAEIYRALEDITEVDEAVVVGREVEGDVVVELYVSLQCGIAIGEKLRQDIASAIRTRCTPRHVPANITQVDDIPKTRNGKISEKAARDAINGRNIANFNQISNPESLAAFSKNK